MFTFKPITSEHVKRSAKILQLLSYGDFMNLDQAHWGPEGKVIERGFTIEDILKIARNTSTEFGAVPRIAQEPDQWKVAYRLDGIIMIVKQEFRNWDSKPCVITMFREGQDIGDIEDYLTPAPTAEVVIKEVVRQVEVAKPIEEMDLDQLEAYIEKRRDKERRERIMKARNELRDIEEQLKINNKEIERLTEKNKQLQTESLILRETISEEREKG